MNGMVHKDSIDRCKPVDLRDGIRSPKIFVIAVPVNIMEKEESLLVLPMVRSVHNRT